MNRETTNRIRFVIEDLLPPILRDSALFRAAAKLVWGEHIVKLARFRERAPFLTAGEYEDLYRHHPRVHAGTDNSAACIARIVDAIDGTSVCDVGCGTGALLSYIRAANPGLTRLTGVDFVVDDAARLDGLEYVAAKIEALPFADGEFDTVVCTHVIEHVLDYRKAIAELRRIARRRLIIVVPREREYRYSFNPHFNFFPYTHSFLRAVHPVPQTHLCIDIGRDIFYCEEPVQRDLEQAA
ncbi:class I SAM-dependent methyltransferase [Mycoplana ramosa]|uniref:Class I SAM-dependent methyltransferase n=1 Tax=Mycoplana ramosa TaxID=40837 RepID=A0ABW3Z0G4_MYCRA